MVTTQPIDFYFDFSSPYGYLAANRIDEIGARHGRDVTWHPILLGAVFKTTGQAPLTTIPVQGDYAKHDMERQARLFGVPFAWPTKFPIASTAACRAFYATADKDTALAKRLALALYDAFFAKNEDISSPDVTLDVAQKLGIDRNALAASLNDPVLKDRLRSEVDAAITCGVFGSPYIVVDGEPFWGSDRLDQVERWLERPW